MGKVHRHLHRHFVPKYLEIQTSCGYIPTGTDISNSFFNLVSYNSHLVVNEKLTRRERVIVAEKYESFLFHTNTPIQIMFSNPYSRNPRPKRLRFQPQKLDKDDIVH